MGQEHHGTVMTHWKRGKMGDFSARKRKSFFVLAFTLAIAIIILLLMVTDTILWRSGSLADIYGCNSYEISSLYVYSMQDGDILFSTEEKDLDKICDTFIHLDWHPIGATQSCISLDTLRNTLQVYVVYKNSSGDERGILIYCTGGDTISVHALNIPRYRKSDMDYQVNGGYDLSWLYELDR